MVSSLCSNEREYNGINGILQTYLPPQEGRYVGSPPLPYGKRSQGWILYAHKYIMYMDTNILERFCLMETRMEIDKERVTFANGQIQI